MSEGFVDRAYTSQGRLVPRGRPEAVLTDAEAVVAQAVRMATAGTVIAVDGTELPMPVRSLCVHGDTPGAVALPDRSDGRIGHLDGLNFSRSGGVAFDRGCAGPR